MTVLALNATVSNAKVSLIVEQLNFDLKAEKLRELVHSNFSTMTDEEKAEELGDATFEEYFSEELSSLELYESKDVGKFQTGQHFTVVTDANDDTVFSFVLTGYSGSSGGIYQCCFIDEQAPVINLDKI